MAFTSKQNKHYASKDEFQRRMGNWKRNHDKVVRMNAVATDVEFEDNFTSDMDDEEYKAMLNSYGGYVGQDMDSQSSDVNQAEDGGEDHGRNLMIDHSINWVD